MRARQLPIKAVVASLMLAIMIEPALRLRWWHPACSSGGIMPYATGFPLPYSQWTAVSSEEYFVSIPALTIDLLVLGVALLPVVRLLSRYAARLNSFVKTVACGAFGLWFCLYAFMYYTISHPVMTIASDGESYSQYRPQFVEPKASSPTCETYN